MFEKFIDLAYKDHGFKAQQKLMLHIHRAYDFNN